MESNNGYGGCGHGCGCGSNASASALIAESLKELGYSADIQNETVVNVADRIDGEAHKIVIVSDPHLTELTITCLVDSLSAAGSTTEEQKDYLFLALDINDHIAPFATTVISPTDPSSQETPMVVLISRTDTDEARLQQTLRWQMQELRRAVIRFNSHVVSLTS